MWNVECGIAPTITFRVKERSLAGEDLKISTKAFALRVIKPVDSLPRERSAEIIGKQLLRCGTSVGANYRSACRAKSVPDFIAEMTIVE